VVAELILVIPTKTWRCKATATGVLDAATPTGASMKSLLLIPGLPLVYAASALYWFVASWVIEQKMGLGPRSLAARTWSARWR
jgi:hypothetical protein